MTNFQQISNKDQQPHREQRTFSFQSTQLIWLFLGLLEALFALRLLFTIIGVSPINTFATLLYGFTGFFLIPLVGLAGTSASGGLALAGATVIAMVIYAVLGWLLERVVWGVFYRPYATVAATKTTIMDQRRP